MKKKHLFWGAGAILVMAAISVACAAYSEQVLRSLLYGRKR